jgi:hypothetical protein
MDENGSGYAFFPELIQRSPYFTGALVPSLLQDRNTYSQNWIDFLAIVPGFCHG